MKRVVVIAFMLASFSSLAVDCPKAKVENIQAEVGHIVYKQVGYDWRKLGKFEEDSVKAMYSALLSAQMAGKPVMVRYPDGYDCNAYEITTPAKVVRTYNN